MNCHICNTETRQLFTAKILSKYEVAYVECPSCRFVQTEDPYWFAEAYKNAINLTDTGLLARNLEFLPIVSSLLYTLFQGKGKYVDYAGGYGVFTRLMRDVGFDYYWVDPYCDNIHAKGFEWHGTEKATALSIFETFEHFRNPMAEVTSLFEKSDTIILSTTCIPSPAPKPGTWWYYGLEHGQHLALYRPETFEYIAKQHGAIYRRYKTIHLLSKVSISDSAFALATRGARVSFQIVKRLMKSKTFSDMQQIIETTS